MIKPTDAQINSAYASSSPEVKELIEEGVLANFVGDFSERFSLSEDQGLVLGLSLRNALLRLASPRDVEQELVSAGVKNETIQQIIEGAKQKLFQLVEKSVAPQKTESSASIPLLPPHQETLPQSPQTGAPAPSSTEPLSRQENDHAPEKPAPRPMAPRTMASDVQAMHSGDTAVPPKPVPPPVVRPPAPTPAAVHEDLKKYGVDPYREPVE